MFDHSWNKGNQRLSQAWEKASKKQDAPAANAAPTSVLLQQLAPDQRKWKGGALKRVGDGLRENEERAAHPKLNMGQPAPRPPAPTAGVGANPLSRSAPGAPAAREAGQQTHKTPVVDDAMREQMERRRLEALRKLAARAPAPGASAASVADAPPVRPVAPFRETPLTCETKEKKSSRPSFEFGPSRDGAARRASGGAARFGRVPSDATAPDQFFGVELFLANEASPDGSVETFDRLHVRAKSFPGYPANAVLSWATSPASPAGETKKWLQEKGEVATWRVTPATAYRALVDRAAREPLLAVHDAVATRIERAKATLSDAEKNLRSAEEECAKFGVDVPEEIAARAKTARRECGTDLNDATEKKARASKHASRVLGATRRHPPFSKRSNPTPTEKEQEKETIPRFARPAWESRDEDDAASPSGDEKKTAAAAAEENKNPRDESRESLGGFDEKGLASVLAAATQLAPGRRVSPATADAADFVRVLRYAQRQHSLNLGVPAFAKGANHFESPHTLRLTLQKVPPLVLRAARRCGFPTDFAQRAATLAKAGVRGAAGADAASPAPKGQPAGTADDVLDLVSDDDDDDDDDDVVVIDFPDEAGAFAAATRPSPQTKPAGFVFASPSVLASALAELRASVGDLEKARSELERVEKAVRNAVKRKRARLFGPREAVFEGNAIGLGVDFATGAGAGWEGQGTASMGMNVNAW